MKKRQFKGVKNFKRMFYKGRIKRFKRIIAAMLAVGIAASLLYFGKYTYFEYAASRANIVLTYPEIALSQKPDGSRFTYYEFINDENIADALEIMQKDGKYKNFAVADLRNCFYLYSYLENSANASVSSARSAGDDFSYVANEYRITFVQPHNFKSGSFAERFFGADYSGDFLNALIEVNRNKLADESGGYNGFVAMTDVGDIKNYDYNEEIRIYRTKIRAIVSYLDALQKASPDFATSDNMSLKDIEGSYNFLVSDKLDGISNFIESSGISKDVTQASNKIKVNIENNTLKYNKYLDRANINKFAMDNYDQTFTENLINVIQNDQYGLYQARPKTAFDTVVEQKHEADESIAEYGAVIKQYNKELEIYGTSDVVQTDSDNNDSKTAAGKDAKKDDNTAKAADKDAKTKTTAVDDAEKERLSSKCEELIADMEKDYQSISHKAQKAVEEYFTVTNKGYITAEIKPRGLITDELVVKMGICFTVGALIAFIAIIFIDSFNDSRKLKRKKEKLRSIKKEADEAKEKEA